MNNSNIAKHPQMTFIPMIHVVFKTEWGITWTGHGSSDGSCWAKRRILINTFSDLSGGRCIRKMDSCILTWKSIQDSEYETAERRREEGEARRATSESARSASARDTQIKVRCICVSLFFCKYYISHTYIYTYVYIYFYIYIYMYICKYKYV